MKWIWTESSIREELERLDAKTGLHGATLPITFSRAQCNLGLYNPQNGGSFRFSNFYFQDPTWPYEDALDTIRHEYAHYMDYELNRIGGHGASWKQCCKVVGATPIRCHSERRTQYYRTKEAQKAQLSERYNRYHVGMKIMHPQYGDGFVKEIIGEQLSRCVTVDFLSVGEKMLNLNWVDKNCKK